MSLAGFQGRVVRVTRRVPGVQKFYERNENLRVTEPVPESINQQWVGDLTYIKTQERACYLATVMDVHSRKIVGWALGKDRTTKLTCWALLKAIRQRNPSPGLIFHSDRGVEYGGIKLRNMLNKYGLRASMSRAYHSQDNAHMESFFHSIKIECIRGKVFTCMEDLRGELFRYIRFYNSYRLHSGIGYNSPNEYERKLK
jgi:putative transposase